MDRKLEEKLFISADATAETLKNAPHLKALDSACVAQVVGAGPFEFKPRVYNFIFT